MVFHDEIFNIFISLTPWVEGKQVCNFCSFELRFTFSYSIFQFSQEGSQKEETNGGENFQVYILQS